MRFRARGFTHRNKKRSIYFRLLILLLLLLMIYIIFDIKLLPVLKVASEVRAKNIAITTINNAVGQVLKEDDISYDKLMSFEKDSTGHITAVKADTLQMNLLKYDITNEVVNDLNNLKGSELAIPLGTVVGGQLFTGRGPRISVKFSPVGNVNSVINNSFTSAGINQTRQQIMLNVSTDITIMMSSYIVTTHVESNFCIAESIIVGTVPNTYFNGIDQAAQNAYLYGSSNKN
jgi:sporulation protein YunB